MRNGSFFGKKPSVQKKNNTTFLPSSKKQKKQNPFFAPRPIIQKKSNEELSEEDVQMKIGNTPLQLKSNVIQRRIGVDDVATEMNGRVFRLTAEFNGIAANTKVIIINWQGANNEAIVEHGPKGARVRATIRKNLLRPDNPQTNGVRTYNVGLDGQRTAVNRSQNSVEEQQTQVDNWRSQEGNYQSNPEYWQAGLARLEAELQRRQSALERRETTMNRMLVRESMYNRFDPLIARWVNHYNNEFNPTPVLDSNVVKSMLFQETRMGTSGEHLEQEPYNWNDGQRHPIRSRFNLGQTVDSWGPQQYLMIKEMAPNIYNRFGLNVLERGRRWNSMSNEDYGRWAAPDGTTFMSIVRIFFEQRNGGNNLMGEQNTDLHLDYNFWIRSTVRWLFHKYNSLGNNSWGEAVRAYNGGGNAARQYSRAVMARAGSQENLNVGNE